MYYISIHTTQSPIIIIITIIIQILIFASSARCHNDLKEMFTPSHDPNHITIATVGTRATICVQTRTLDQAGRMQNDTIWKNKEPFPTFHFFALKLRSLHLDYWTCPLTIDYKHVNWLHITGDCRLLPPCIRNLRSSGILRSVASYRRFGTTYRSHLQRSSSFLLGLLDPWRCDR
jgi:hypothetical protein